MLFLCWLLLLIQKLWVHSTYIEFFEDWSPERGKVWKTRLWFRNVLDENAAMLALLAHRDVPTFSHQNMVYECLWCMKLSLKIRYLQTPEFFSTLKLLMHALNLSKKPMAKQPGFGVWSLNLWSLQLSHHLSIFYVLLIIWVLAHLHTERGTTSGSKHVRRLTWHKSTTNSPSAHVSKLKPVRLLIFCSGN